MTRPTATCAACRRPMFDVGFPDHPRCGPEEDAHVYGVTFPNASAVLESVAKAHPDAVARGVQIILDAARKHRFLSANETRPEFTRKGVLGPSVGAAWKQAAKDGHVVQDGFVPSKKGNTHGHRIARYRSCRFEQEVA